MSIKIAKSDFEQAVSVVGNSVARTGLDITSHLIFRVQDGKMTLFSNLNRVFGSCPAVVEVEGPEDQNVVFTIQATRVAKMLAAVGDGVLTLKLTRTGERVTEVEVEMDRGSIEFSSIDPGMFPFWDDMLAEAKETAIVSADRLSAAFSHAKMFISSDDQKSPHLCVAEFRDGCLFSTDQTAVSTVWVEGMEKSAIRVHAKDLGAVIAFLDKADKTPVTILEHERAMFIRRADGAIFGETLFNARFPDFPVDRDAEDEFTWEIIREEFNADLRLLLAGANDDNIIMTLTPRGNDLLMSMLSASNKPMSLVLKSLKHTQKDGAVLPNGRFTIDPTRVMHAMSDHSSSTLTVGVTQRKKGGWLRVRDDRGTEPGAKDIILTTVAWQKTPNA